MNRNFGILTALFTLIVLVIVGCGGAQTTPPAPPLMKASTETPSLVVPTATPTRVPPTATPTLGIGSRQVSDKDGMTLLYVPAGEFKMGAASSDTQASANEKPQHTVYLDAFWIDQTEVTNAMYAKCVKAGACQAPESR